MSGKLHALLGTAIGWGLTLVAYQVYTALISTALLNMIVITHLFGVFIIGFFIVTGTLADDFTERDIKNLGWTGVAFYTICGFFNLPLLLIEEK